MQAGDLQQVWSTELKYCASQKWPSRRRRLSAKQDMRGTDWSLATTCGSCIGHSSKLGTRMSKWILIRLVWFLHRPAMLYLQRTATQGRDLIEDR